MSKHSLLYNRPLLVGSEAGGGTNDIALVGPYIGYLPTSAYSTSLRIENAMGKCTGELLTEGLPPGANVYVNNFTKRLILRWPEYTGTPTTLVPNGDFEAGNDGQWILGEGWSITANANNFGAYSATFNGFRGTSEIRTGMFPVFSGVSVTAVAQINQGASAAGNVGAGVGLRWFNAAREPISDVFGNVVDSASNGAIYPSTVTASAPVGSVYAAIVIRGTRTSENKPLWADNVTWNLSYQPGWDDDNVFEDVTVRVTDAAGRSATFTGDIQVLDATQIQWVQTSALRSWGDHQPGNGGGHWAHSPDYMVLANSAYDATPQVTIPLSTDGGYNYSQVPLPATYNKPTDVCWSPVLNTIIVVTSNNTTTRTFHEVDLDTLTMAPMFTFVGLGNGDDRLEAHHSGTMCLMTDGSRVNFRTAAGTWSQLIQLGGTNYGRAMYLMGDYYVVANAGNTGAGTVLFYDAFNGSLVATVSAGGGIFRGSLVYDEVRNACVCATSLQKLRAISLDDFSYEDLTSFGTVLAQTNHQGLAYSPTDQVFTCGIWSTSTQQAMFANGAWIQSVGNSGQMKNIIWSPILQRFVSHSSAGDGLWEGIIQRL